MDGRLGWCGTAACELASSSSTGTLSSFFFFLDNFLAGTMRSVLPPRPDEALGSSSFNRTRRSRRMWG